MTRRWTRTEVPKEQTWATEYLYETQQEWEVEYHALGADLATVTQYKGRLGEGAATLRACLNALEAYRVRLGRLSLYTYLRASEDGTDPVNQARTGHMAGLQAKAGAALSFINSELLALPDGTLAQYMAADVDLAGLRTYLTLIVADKPYLLSPETEGVLAALGEVMNAPYAIYQRTKASDMSFASFMDGAGHQLENSFALYEDTYERDADTTTRRNAFTAFTEGLTRYQHTLGATFATEITRHTVMAKLRGFPSAVDMHLHGQQVSQAAYNNVLDIIQEELAPHMRRYARLRKRVLGLSELHYCDIEAPLDPAYDPKMSIDEAWPVLLDAFSVLGDEYMEIMTEARRGRWVDYSDNVGKATGAFCASPYGLQSYILMTWTGTMRSAFILAHELGHGGHFQLANRYQRSLNTRPSSFFVECPSTLNEMLLGQHIMASSKDDRVRRWVIMQFLGTYHHNFVRHLLEGELERQMYRGAAAGKPITASVLSQQKGEILDRFWGGEVVIDEGARLTWMRQPHYYGNLYPYGYAAGLCASTAIGQLIREEGRPAVERYLTALKAGGTLGPMELMAMAGVDYAGPEPIRKAVAYVGSLVDELEGLFG